MSDHHRLVLLDERDDLALEAESIPTVSLFAEPGHDRSHIIAVPLAQREEQSDQGVLEVGADPATMPRSISASRPSEVSRTFPGWGSVWTNPSTRIWSR
ncbi:MAG TPA: hypothetical protein VFH56_16435 [Acidimicrobiales bacterium]|nr:hypothetical protein [Acidimicrobiales bacterium]